MLVLSSYYNKKQPQHCSYARLIRPVIQCSFWYQFPKLDTNSTLSVKIYSKS